MHARSPGYQHLGFPLSPRHTAGGSLERVCTLGDEVPFRWLFSPSCQD